MKTELSPEDKQRIEQEAIRLTNWETGYTPLDKNSDFYKGAIKGAEYENKYQREQQEQVRRDAYDAGLMCQSILDKDQIEKLEAERSELLAEIERLKKAMSEQKHTPEERKIQPMPEQLENKLTEYIMLSGFQLETRMYLRHGARWVYSELLQQVAELTKENEQLKSFEEYSKSCTYKCRTDLEKHTCQCYNDWCQQNDLNKLLDEKDTKIKALTEQVEKLTDKLRFADKHIALLQGKEATELSRLREREKQLVEALREVFQEQLPNNANGGITSPLWYKIESLLSKFEEPNQS